MFQHARFQPWSVRKFVLLRMAIADCMHKNGVFHRRGAIFISLLLPAAPYVVLRTSSTWMFHLSGLKMREEWQKAGEGGAGA